MALLDRDRVCQTEGEVKRATVGTSPIRDPGTVSFPAGKVSASLRGKAALDASGRPEAWFDPTQPIEMRFSASGQATISISSTLPLEHRVVIDRREHILTVKPGNRRGQVELQLRVCEYP